MLRVLFLTWQPETRASETSYDSDMMDVRVVQKNCWDTQIFDTNKQKSVGCKQDFPVLQVQFWCQIFAVTTHKITIVDLSIEPLNNILFYRHEENSPLLLTVAPWSLSIAWYFYHVSGLIQRSGHTSVAFWHSGGISFTTIKCQFCTFCRMGWRNITSHITSWNHWAEPGQLTHILSIVDQSSTQLADV